MPEERDPAFVAFFTALSFWLGTLPVAICDSAYWKLWRGEGVGYEGGVSGFIGFTVVMGVVHGAVAGLLFFVVLLGRTGSRNPPTEPDWYLYVGGGVAGLLWALLWFCIGVWGS